MAEPKAKPAAKPTAAEAQAKIERYHADIMRKNFFQILGADRDTEPDKIRAQYHNLARKWHSDAFTGLQLGPSKAKLDEIFQRIGEAYETLTTPAQRSEYITLVDRQKKGLVTDVNAIFRAEEMVDNAMAKIRRKDWASAKEDLEEAIELNPDDPLYSATLGWVLYNLNKRNDKKVKEAIDTIKAALKRQEAMPIAYQYLGQIHFAQDRGAEAIKWWKKCLEWDPKNIDAARGIRLVTTRKEKKASGLSGLINKLLGRK